MKNIVRSLRQPIHVTQLARVIILCIMVLVLLPAAGTSSALADTAGKSTEVGLGIASFITTLPYGAVKIAYAGLGAIIWWVHVSSHSWRSRFSQCHMGKVFTGPLCHYP